MKLYARKTHCVKFTEIASHALFLLLAISSSVLNYRILDINNYIIYAVMGIILIISIFTYSILFSAFLFLIRFFKYHNKKGKGVKYMVIKLFFFLIICITYVIIGQRYLKYSIGCFFILSILVVSLNNPLGIWCCKHCFRRSPGHAPLLSLPMAQRDSRQIQYQRGTTEMYPVIL